jgi:DnaJ-class molecular chaperone
MTAIETCPRCYGLGEVVRAGTEPDTCAQCGGRGHVACAPAVLMTRVNAPTVRREGGIR